MQSSSEYETPVTDAYYQTQIALQWTRESVIAEDLQLNIVRSGPGKLVHALASNPGLLPQVQLEIADRGDDLLNITLCENAALIEELQARFVADGNTWFNLAANAGLLPRLQRVLFEQGSDDLKYMLASNTALLPELQIIMLESESSGLARALASNEGLTAQAQHLLVEIWPSLMHYLLTNNSLVEDLQLQALTDNRNRYFMSDNPNLVSSVVEDLGRDPDEEIRQRVARNCKLGPELQLELANDESSHVREGLANNPNTYVTLDFPVRLLVENGISLPEYLIPKEGFEIEVYESLAKGWPGTIGQLLRACSRL